MTHGTRGGKLVTSESLFLQFLMKFVGGLNSAGRPFGPVEGGPCSTHRWILLLPDGDNCVDQCLVM